VPGLTSGRNKPKLFLMSKPEKTGKPLTIHSLRQMKEQGRKIAIIACYDFHMARMADEAGIEGIIVGDSVAMVIQGHDTTLPVTMDQMLYHTDMVARGCKRGLVIGDMPFMSYQASISQAIANAGRFLKEAGACAVKIEGGSQIAELVKTLTQAGIPVMGHIGLTPQAHHQLGGFKVQREKERLIEDAEALEAAGAFSVVIEAVPTDIGAAITEKVSIPTIGIGAGPSCDGQVLVAHDILGLLDGFRPKFVKAYAELAPVVRQSFADYLKEVKEGAFPDEGHVYK